MSEPHASKWEPVDFTTPPAWHRFWGRRIGSTTIGAAAAFCPTALYFGIEVLTGGMRGISFVVGPFWVGFACLRKKSKEHD